MQTRTAEVRRQTKETDITLSLCLDGRGTCDCRTGVGFFDHMLDGFARHGVFDLTLRCDGDLHVDPHHTVEDVGIALGTAIRQAAGDKAGIRRFGQCILPMDDALVLCALDLSGRPYYCSDVQYAAQTIGDMPTELFREFFYAVSYTAQMNLHFKMLSGENSHHIAEACFKAFAKALDMATSAEQRVPGVWSTKGSL